MSNTTEPMTNHTIEGSFNYGLLKVIQNLGGTFYKVSSLQVREVLKHQLAADKAAPISKWNRPEEIASFETAFDSLQKVFNEIDEAEKAAGIQPR